MSNNTLSRLVTASILLPIVIIIIFQASVQQLYLFVGIIWAATFYELVRIMRFNLLGRVFCMAAFISSLFSVGNIDFWLIFVCYSLVFLLGVLMLVYYPFTKKSVIFPIIGICGAIVIFASSFTSMMYLIKQNRTYVLLTCIFVWLADSGAYVHGKLFGKTKLCATISPGKTWAGVGGACMWTLLFVVVCVKFAITYKVFIFWVLGIITAIYGDLIESLVKRINNVKDSSNILPGHGGLLDRLDSLLFFLPVSLFGVKYLL